MNKIIVICVLVVSCSSFAYELDGVNDSTLIDVDGLPLSVKELKANFKSCKNKKIIRGEYESKAEYKIRSKSISASCNNLRKLEGFIELPVKLSYNADDEKFTFKLVESQPTSLIIAKKFYNPNCVPRSDWWKDSWMGEYHGGGADRLVKKGSKSFGRSYNCPSVDFKIDRAFFTKLTSNVMVYAWFGKGKCKCKKSVLFKCERASCSRNPLREISEIREFSVNVYSPIQKARTLKSMESSLRIRFIGNLEFNNKSEGYSYLVENIALVNLETEKELFILY
ncbi:MAG: hypothetical protein OCD00_12865 [Colwellia sp.]